MSSDKNKDKNKKILNPENFGEEDSGSEGQGGKSGQIEFRDFLGSERFRDDELSPSEKKRLLSIHQETHEIRVKKQKNASNQLKALKEGKVSLSTYREGRVEGRGHSYKDNPKLVDKIQFSGRDKRESVLPNENIAETNEEKRNELQYQPQLRYAPNQAPRFIPPKLTR